jgi:DNA-binding SARP family transcriptional activator/basic membrane lipoprotein Med (substrate-binding protein (PBP1-ABC) superfamily)
VPPPEEGHAVAAAAAPIPTVRSTIPISPSHAANFSDVARKQLAARSRCLFSRVRPCLASGGTNGQNRIAFRLLGPFQAQVGDRALALGGPKQRAVLAMLVLREGEVVRVEQLIDAVWGEDPPDSASHALETYVSRLRVLLEPHGLRVLRGGRGYLLNPGGSDIDARDFEAELTEAREASDTGDAQRAWELSTLALARWRGPALADTPLSSPGRAEVERLEEMRLRALEVHAETALALRRHHDLPTEIGPLVAEHPLRETLVGTLMIALYRSGRQAEALDVYEATRRAFLELGLHPSRELQELSGAIVRQADDLQAPARARPPGPRARKRTVAAALLAVAVAASSSALIIAATRRGDDAAVAAPGARVALILPRAPLAGKNDPYLSPFIDGLRLAKRQFGLQTQRLVGKDFVSDARLAATVRRGNFDLVLLAAPTVGGPAFLRATQQLKSTRFVLLDAYIHNTSYRGQENVTAVRFDDEQAGYLAGYLSGLIEKTRPARHGRRVISAIGAYQAIPTVEALMKGFARGAREILPSVTILQNYSGDFNRQSRCADVANRQIDAGSKILFTAAGNCGLGALAAAGLRGVSAIGSDKDYHLLGPHILASAIKRFDLAVLTSIRWYIEGTLPPAGEIELTVEDDAISLALSPDVPDSIRREIAHVDAKLRANSDGRGP